MLKSTKWGVAVVCGAMLIGLLPANESEGGLFGRRGCGSHGGWRGGWGSHGGWNNGCGSHGGYRNGCGSHGGYSNGHGSHGGYASNGCGSHGGYSNGHHVEYSEATPHESQYHGEPMQDSAEMQDGENRESNAAQDQSNAEAPQAQPQETNQQPALEQPSNQTDSTQAPQNEGLNRSDAADQPPAPPQRGEAATDAASDAAAGALESTPQQ